MAMWQDGGGAMCAGPRRNHRQRRRGVRWLPRLHGKTEWAVRAAAQSNSSARTAATRDRQTAAPCGHMVVLCIAARPTANASVRAASGWQSCRRPWVSCVKGLRSPWVSETLTRRTNNTFGVDPAQSMGLVMSVVTGFRDFIERRKCARLCVCDHVFCQSVGSGIMCWAQGSGYRVQGSGFRVQASGFRV